MKSLILLSHTVAARFLFNLYFSRVGNEQTAEVGAPRSAAFDWLPGGTVERMAIIKYDKCEVSGGFTGNSGRFSSDSILASVSFSIKSLPG